jgi:CubicO group peptidase (beta-lactamase class C family)
MKTILLFISILLLCTYGCQKDFSDHWPYNPPVFINDGIDTGTLDMVNIDIEMITKAVGRIEQGKYNEVHSMLIYKNDMLVFEEYFSGHKFDWERANYYGEWVEWNINSKHKIMSCTKSFTSACINIAIEKGFIVSVNQSIFDYLPNHQDFTTCKKKNITIEHLLTMTSGLQWDEWSAPHATADNDIDRLFIECWEDPIRCVLEKSMESDPGESFTYNGGGMIILGEILKNATGMNIVEFANLYLFEPLGIENILWDRFPNGEIEAGGGLKITSRDMLKFGITYLNNGIWDGERIISANWVENSTRLFNNNSDIKIPGEDSGKNGYSYSWWTKDLSYSGEKINMFRANGWGGQSIMVFPDLEMVIVFTGGNYDENTSLFEIIERFIIPAIL